MYDFRLQLLNIFIAVILSVIINVVIQIYFNHHARQPSSHEESSQAVNVITSDDLRADLVKQNQINGMQSKQIYTLEKRLIEVNTRLIQLQEKLKM